MRAGQALAARLDELKHRSGHSYEYIGGRANLSRSTVHRYCKGVSFPAAFGAVEKIASVCGADQRELSKLYRLWEQAQLPVAEAKPEIPVEQPRPLVKRPRPLLRLAVVLAVLLLAAGASAQHVAPDRDFAENVPIWTNRPFAVPDEFVGVTKNAASREMPGFGVGALRLWNSGSRWSKLEPQRGVYDWPKLDRHVEPAERAGIPLLLTLNGTPGWASPDGPEMNFSERPRTSAPDDPAVWENYVRTVATRYRGRIQAYEVWDAANVEAGYSGTVEKMVELTARASRAIKESDPNAFVICPGMAELWDPSALAWLERFANLGGYSHCHAAAIKLHPRRTSDRPETMVELAARVDRALYRSGRWTPPLWNTGQGFSMQLDLPLKPETAANYAVRYYLVSLYAEYRRVYFYNWGHDRLPITLQPHGGRPTRAALHVQALNEWLDRTQNTFCGQGEKAGLPHNAWECRFHRDGEELRIWWTDRGTARVPAPPSVVAVHTLDGDRRLVSPGDLVDVTESPVQLRSR